MSKRRTPSDDEAARPELGGPGASPAGETSPVANFESQLARLEQIVADLETGDLGLEEALGRFEAGVGLLRQCQATLTAAERQIELLTGIQPDGTIRTEPFPDQV
jgi:exodeoxyribonuclease VII small subunit